MDNGTAIGTGSPGAIRARTTSRSPVPDGPPGVRPLVELDTVSKVFGGTVAVHEVSLALRPGEVLALVGENGAGKSTCAKLLAGVHQPDGGRVVVDGEETRLASPQVALARGIGVVHQHPGLFPDLSIAENVFMGHLPRGRRGVVDGARMRGRCADLLDQLGLDAGPDLPLAALSASEQQLVEVARCLAADVRVLVLDEPTAALSAAEVDRLFGVVDELRADGVAILFVGHRLDEIFRIADRIAVMRDGGLVAVSAARCTDPSEVVRSMVGRDVTTIHRESAGQAGEVALRVRGLGRDGAFDDVSFDLHRGEVLGIAGIVGSGRTEVARALFGVDRADVGTMQLFGQPFAPSSPAEAIAHGVAYVSEDRRGQSLIEDFSILHNATLPVISRGARVGLVRRRRETALVADHLSRLKLKAEGLDQSTRALSGGNQQKVVLAKWLATEPKVLILDEPTQGVDVGAKTEVHRIIAELAESGLAVLLISSDMPEVLGMSDRILVLRGGRVVRELAGTEADEFAVAAAATGLHEDVDVPSRPDALEADTAPGHAGSVAAAPDGPARAGPVRAAGRRASAGTRSGWWSSRQAGLAISLAVLAIPLGLLNPRLFSAGNVSDLLIAASLIGVVALGEMLVMLTRNIDLSVSSIIGLTAFLSASTMRDHPEVSAAGALGLALLVGALCGAVNGALVAYGRVSAIVTTLGTLAAYRGVVSIVASGQQVSAGSVPDSWLRMTAYRPLGVPVLIWIGVLTAVAVAVFLRSTATGRELFAVGSNPDGADLIGVPTRRRVFTAFVASGAMAGFAGALWASRYATVDGQMAVGAELTVIAAVVVGGVALRGGSGTVVGVALGTVTLLVLQNALTLAGVDSRYLQAVFGAAILLAVLLDSMVARRNASTAARRR